MCVCIYYNSMLLESTINLRTQLTSLHIYDVKIVHINIQAHQTKSKAWTLKVIAMIYCLLDFIVNLRHYVLSQIQYKLAMFVQSLYYMPSHH